MRQIVSRSEEAWFFSRKEFHKIFLCRKIFVSGWVAVFMERYRPRAVCLVKQEAAGMRQIVSRSAKWRFCSRKEFHKIFLCRKISVRGRVTDFMKRYRPRAICLVKQEAAGMRQIVSRSAKWRFCSRKEFHEIFLCRKIFVRGSSYGFYGTCRPHAVCLVKQEAAGMRQIVSRSEEAWFFSRKEFHENFSLQKNFREGFGYGFHGTCRPRAVCLVKQEAAGMRQIVSRSAKWRFCSRKEFHENFSLQKNFREGVGLRFSWNVIAHMRSASP